MKFNYQRLHKLFFIKLERWPEMRDLYSKKSNEDAVFITTNIFLLIIKYYEACIISQYNVQKSKGNEIAIPYSRSAMALYTSLTISSKEDFSLRPSLIQAPLMKDKIRLPLSFLKVEFTL